MNSPVWILVGAGLGYVGSALQQFFNDRRLERREDRNRQLSRDEARQDRRDAFQRETLLALQDAMQALGRATGAIHHRDTMHHRSTGEPYGRQQLESEWDEKLRLSLAEVGKLVSRVQDDELRLLAQQLLNWTTAVTMAESEEDAKAAMDCGLGVYFAAVDRAGELIRAVH